MNTTSWSRAALEYEAQNIRNSPSRADARRALLAGAASLYEICAGGTLDAGLIDGTLTAAAREANIPLGDIKRSLLWGSKKGMANPRVAPLNMSEPADINDRRIQIHDWYNQVWNSDLGASEKRTAYILAAMALRLGKTRFSASHRQLAEEMNTSFSIVSKLTKSLGGFLLINAKGNRIQGTATTWQLAIDGTPLTGFEGVTVDTGRRPNSSEKDRLQSIIPPTPSGTTELVSQASLLSPDHSLWMRRQNAWMLYSMLAAGERFNIKGLAAKLDMNDRTIRNNLRFLADQGLARQLGREEGWVWEVVPLDEEVPDDRSPKERRRQAHAEQRKHWKVWATNIVRARRTAARRRSHKVASARSLRLTSLDISKDNLNAYSDQAGRPAKRHEVLLEGLKGRRHGSDGGCDPNHRPGRLGSPIQGE